jgi:hypothetical protein
MQAHVRNNVKPSIGRVITSDLFRYVDVSLISLLVAGCSQRDWLKWPSLCTERWVLFDLFYRVHLLVEKAVTRTSKTLIAGVLLNISFVQNI